jgi:hydroxylaminobenzene mutase
MKIKIMRHGFFLILLALISGMFVSQMAVPRLGLSAHTIGILSGVLLVSVGAVFQEFALSNNQAKLMYWSWLVSSYLNWFACLVGAFLGTGAATPIASNGLKGNFFNELIVTSMLVVVVVTSFIAVGLSIWGLKTKAKNLTKVST